MLQMKLENLAFLQNHHVTVFLMACYACIYLLYSLLRAVGMYTALIALEYLLQVWAAVFARDYGGNCRG